MINYYLNKINSLRFVLGDLNPPFSDLLRFWSKSREDEVVLNELETGNGELKGRGYVFLDGTSSVLMDEFLEITNDTDNITTTIEFYDFQNDGTSYFFGQEPQSSTQWIGFLNNNFYIYSTSLTSFGGGWSAITGRTIMTISSVPLGGGQAEITVTFDYDGGTLSATRTRNTPVQMNRLFARNTALFMDANGICCVKNVKNGTTILNYDFGEFAGVRCFDSSGNGNHGTFQGTLANLRQLDFTKTPIAVDDGCTHGIWFNGVDAEARSTTLTWDVNQDHIVKIRGFSKAAQAGRSTIFGQIASVNDASKPFVIGHSEEVEYEGFVFGLAKIGNNDLYRVIDSVELFRNKPIDIEIQYTSSNQSYRVWLNGVERTIETVPATLSWLNNTVFGNFDETTTTNFDRFDGLLQYGELDGVTWCDYWNGFSSDFQTKTNVDVVEIPANSSNPNKDAYFGGDLMNPASVNIIPGVEAWIDFSNAPTDVKNLMDKQNAIQWNQTLINDQYLDTSNYFLWHKAQLNMVAMRFYANPSQQYVYFENSQVAFNIYDILKQILIYTTNLDTAQDSKVSSYIGEQGYE
jgi:hypothetical protein